MDLVEMLRARNPRLSKIEAQDLMEQEGEEELRMQLVAADLFDNIDDA